MIERNGWLERRPARRRIVVALFLALSAFSGSFKVSSPTPETVKVERFLAFFLVICTPKDLRQLIVARQSLPGAKLLISALPSAKLLRISAR
jgi:hypothetical protein